MHLDDGLKGVDAHAMEDRVAQNTRIVDDAVELAKAVDRHLDDLARRNRLGNGFEIRDRRTAALLDFLDHFFGWGGARSGAVASDAGIAAYDLGAFRRAEQRDLTTDTAPCAGYNDGFVLE